MTPGYHAVIAANGSQIIVDSAWVGNSSGCTTYTSCPSVFGDLFLSYDADSVYGAGGEQTIELSE